MKIAMVSLDASPLNPDPSGHRVAELASAIARQQHDVTVYAADPSLPEQSTTNGYVIRHLPSNAADFANEFVARMQLDKPDVVHSQSWASSLVSTMSARQAHVPLVLTAHDASRPPAPVDRALYQAADRIIATTERGAAVLVRAGARRARVCVVPPGVDAELFQPIGPSAPLTMPHRVVWLGEPLSFDRFDVSTVVPGTEFITLGGSASPMSAQQRATLLRSADLAVCAGTSAEQESLTLEAMSCGVPVIAIVPGGPGDMVVHGTTGLHLPRGNAREFVRTVRGLVGDPTHRELLGTTAHDRACVRYSWDRISSDVIHAYDQALSAHRGTAQHAVASRGSTRPALSMSSRHSSDST